MGGGFARLPFPCKLLEVFIFRSPSGCNSILDFCKSPKMHVFAIQKNAGSVISRPVGAYAHNLWGLPAVAEFVLGVLGRCGNPQICPTVVPRVSVDVVDVAPNRDLCSHHGKNDPVGSIEIQLPMAVEANRNPCPATRFVGELAPRLSSGPPLVESKVTTLWPKVMPWSELPFQGARLWVVIKALLQELCWRKWFGKSGIFANFSQFFTHLHYGLRITGRGDLTNRLCPALSL